MIHSSSFALIPKKDYPFFKKFIMKDLVFTENEQINVYFEETNDFWIVPRYYPEFKFKEAQVKHYSIDYFVPKYSEIEFKCSIEYRNEDQRNAVLYLSNSDRFNILKARPGFGKTVCTIKAIHLLGMKTLIVVHSLDLAKQWVEKIVYFTDIKADDIPIFSGHLKKEYLDQMKIGIAIIHTLSNRYLARKKEYHELMINSGIGTVVFDECHTTVPTPFFQKGQGLLYAKKYIGLSATPFRNTDIKTKLIYYNLGSYVYDTGNYDIKPEIYEIYFSSHIPEKTKRWISWGGNFILQRYLKKVIESESYINLVLKLIKNAYDDNRHILVLCPRKETLQFFGEKLKEIYNITDVGYFWSGQPKDELQHKVVLATTQIFSEGLDVPTLDTLIVLDQFADKTRLEQMIGRILRHHKDKKQPKVIFLVDRDFQIQHFLSLKRRKVYNQLGFTFKVI